MENSKGDDGDGPERAGVPDAELIGGPEKVPIVIADPDPAWRGRYADVASTIRRELGARALRVDHIGSISVPFLAAKPIVDIQVSVHDVEDEPAYLVALEDAGFHLRVREPGHRMFRTAARDVHIHLCAGGSAWERRHLVFREWLRHDAADRELYEAAKRALAREEWESQNHYAEAKNGVIDEITVRAERWAALTKWEFPPPE